MKRFFTKNQLLLLNLFYINPQKSFYMQEIGRIVGKKPGVFQRTLNRLVEEGLLISEYRANMRSFQANTAHPLYPEFKNIVSKTAGIETELRALLTPLREIKLAFIYGSFAKGTEGRASDIDLLLVGNPEVEGKLLKKLSSLERRIQREVNYKFYSAAEFKRKCHSDPFLEEILNDKNVLLKGSPDAL